MKKTLIALTLAALPVASMAEVVLYGQIKGGVEVTKVKDVKGTVTNIVDYGSRIGFKGQEQLNDSLKAIWQLEQSVNIGGGDSTKMIGDKKVKEAAGFGTRDSFIGLESPAGTVKVGNLSTPVKDANGRLDDWEYADNAAGLGTFTRGNDAVGRRVAVQYETPNMGGFSAKAYVSPSDNNRMEGDDANQTAGGKSDNRRYDRAVYGLGFTYDQGFFADVSGVYVKNGKNNMDTKADGKKKHAYQGVAQFGYNNDNMLFGVAYQQARNVDKGMMARSQEVAATAAYTINNALTVKGSAVHGFNIKDVNGNKLHGNGKYLQGILGADYKLSKRTQLNGQVGYLQFGKKDHRDARGTVGIGVKHKF